MRAGSHQHGDKGVYYQGEWLDIVSLGASTAASFFCLFCRANRLPLKEHCADKFNLKCSTDCGVCPRSRSRNSAALADGSYDVIIVGAGCIGGAIARELSRFQLSVLVLESADDASQGATKGNSGIVHAGFDDAPGSVRAKYCWKGNQMFPELDRDLRFGYQKNGSLVLATNEEEVKHLHELLKRGEKNGVQRLAILQRDEILKLEPYVSKDVVAALYSPDAGNLIPYEFAIAVMENAVDNGVEFRIRRHVNAIKKLADGKFEVAARHWEPKAFVDATMSAAAPGKEKEEESGSRAPLWLGFALGLLVVLLQWLKVPFIAACGMAALIFVAGYKLLSKPGSKAVAAKPAAARILLSVGSGGAIIPANLMAAGGSGSAEVMEGKTIEQEAFVAKMVINSAGSGSDKIANLIGDTSFKIKPRLGDYLLLNRSQGKFAKCTLFPCPGPLGKGILVQQTLWGNLILGPTARDLHNPEHMNQSNEDVQRFILAKCRKLVDAFDPKEVIHAFSGIRAKSDRNDWIIERSAKADNFINVAGIDSPGLAGCPAIALEVVRMVGESLKLAPNPNFNPNRGAIIVPKTGFKVCGQHCAFGLLKLFFLPPFSRV